jgi:hypothetical protein
MANRYSIPLEYSAYSTHIQTLNSKVKLKLLQLPSQRDGQTIKNVNWQEGSWADSQEGRQAGQEVNQIDYQYPPNSASVGKRIRCQ